MVSADANDDPLRILAIVIGIVVLVPLLLMVVAVPMMGMMGWGWGGGMAGGLSPIWGLGMMLVWLLVLLGIGYLLYRGVAGGLATDAGTDPALEELRLAYARGDLTEEEFEERRSLLRRDD